MYICMHACLYVSKGRNFALLWNFFQRDVRGSSTATADARYAHAPIGPVHEKLGAIGGELFCFLCRERRVLIR